jgi:hypothetical protein
MWFCHDDKDQNVLGDAQNFVKWKLQVPNLSLVQDSHRWKLYLLKKLGFIFLGVHMAQNLGLEIQI